MQAYQPSWVDLAIVAVLIVGMVRGRKRGVSEELLDVLKWLVVVVGGAFVYRPVGQVLAEMTPFSLLSCYVAVYMLIMVSVVGFVSVLKRAVGEKLVASEVFGNGEYYLGVVAGLVRYACITLFVLSILNARHYAGEEVAAKRKTQMDNFGMVLFSFSAVQAEVFQRSILGSLTKEHLEVLLIEPTAPQDKGLNRGVRAREKRVNEILE